MIELLINRQTHLPIAAKPLGSSWSDDELDGRNLCVVRLADPPAELAEAVGRRGVVANPFADYEQREIAPGGPSRPIMVRQSTIELQPADVRPGAVVKFADCAVVHG